jgi:CheY-like chemotaxis protein
VIELINDLLDLARFDSGDIEHHATSFSLQDWLATTLEPLELTARAKGLSLTWHVDRRGRVIHADRVKLSRVLTNLVGNAVKFTDAGFVRIDVGETDEGWLQVDVADTGPGIPADQLDRIFDEFAQLRNPERDRTKGTGLGLAICKRLVEAVGGRLTVTSQLGQGSTFSAFYPPDHLGDTELDIPQLAARRAAEVAPHAPILVVEDDPRSRQALERLLQKAGYTVVTAADGPAAIAIVAGERPSLVLLDLMLPGMDGLELLRWFRAQPGCEALPVLLLSGDVITGAVDTLNDLNVASVLAKPVDFDALLTTIARHLRGVKAGK